MSYSNEDIADHHRSNYRYSAVNKIFLSEELVKDKGQAEHSTVYRKAKQKNINRNNNFIWKRYL